MFKEIVVTEHDPEENPMMAHPDVDQAVGRDGNGPIFNAPDLEEGDGSQS